jgi:hypothetical protein
LLQDLPSVAYRWPRFGVLACAAVLLACSPTAQSNAQDSPPGVLTSTGFATTVPKRADFVDKSRPDQMDFIPVGVTPPARAVAPRKPADITKLQAELEATRRSHDRLAGRKEGTGSKLAGDLKKKKPPQQP